LSNQADSFAFGFWDELDNLGHLGLRLTLPRERSILAKDMGRVGCLNRPAHRKAAYRNMEGTFSYDSRNSKQTAVTLVDAVQHVFPPSLRQLRMQRCKRSLVKERLLRPECAGCPRNRQAVDASAWPQGHRRMPRLFAGVACVVAKELMRRHLAQITQS